MLRWLKKRGEDFLPPYSNKEWISLLQSPPDERAIEELRAILLRGLKPALSGYLDREPDPFIEDVAQDAMLKILDNIASFRDESKFTTWAMKIAVREGLTVLRRKKWNDISLEDLNSLKDNSGSKEIFSLKFSSDEPTPELLTAQKLMVKKVERIIQEVLTSKQREVLVLLMIHQLPFSIVAEQMNTSRNSLYKLLHDARQKIKNVLELEGLDPEDILNEFSES